MTWFKQYHYGRKDGRCKYGRREVWREWRPFGVKNEIKQPRRRRQQKPHKFAYLTMKNSIFGRFARAFFFFWHFDVLVLSTTWNDLFCGCLVDVSIWWHMFNFVLLSQKCWFKFNCRIVRTHFARAMTLNKFDILKKREVTFSNDVLAVVNVVFA